MNNNYPIDIIEILKNSIMTISKTKKLKEKIIKYTNFLDIDTSISVRIWYIRNNHIEIVKCPVCKINNSRQKFDKFGNIMSCSYRCSMSTVDPKTGLTGYQTMGKTNLLKNSRIDPITGLTNLELKNIKLHKTMSEIDIKTGLTCYEKISIKRTASAYDKILRNFPDIYKLITPKHSYLDNKNHILKYSCNKCESIRESYWPYIRCTKCYPYNKSICEHEVLEFCQSLTPNIQSNSRQIITPLELDIYIPDYNLAIEYNGLFWHSSYSIEFENKDYHLNKTKDLEIDNQESTWQI